MLQKEILQSEINEVQLLNILEKIKEVRIGVVGDGCLDIYWDADMRLSELSRETPHHPLPVVNERIYLGAGSNVAANICSLNAGSVSFLSLIGRDWRGHDLLAALKEWGIDTRFMLTDEGRVTPAYCKPMRKGYSEVRYEDPRIDFENRVSLSEEQEAAIIKSIISLSETVDAIVVCDQFRWGIISDSVRLALEDLARKGKTVIADSRSKIGLYRNMIIKPNEMEAMMALDEAEYLTEADSDSLAKVAVKLYEQNSAPVIITMGSKGALWYAGEQVYKVDGVPVEPPIDIVGAGDTFLAAFTCAYAAGFSGSECIAFANLASSIVIKKIGLTGTASPEEILEQAKKILSSRG